MISTDGSGHTFPSVKGVRRKVEELKHKDRSTDRNHCDETFLDARVLQDLSTNSPLKKARLSDTLSDDFDKDSTSLEKIDLNLERGAILDTDRSSFFNLNLLASEASSCIDAFDTPVGAKKSPICFRHLCRSFLIEKGTLKPVPVEDHSFSQKKSPSSSSQKLTTPQTVDELRQFVSQSPELDSQTIRNELEGYNRSVDS